MDKDNFNIKNLLATVPHEQLIEMIQEKIGTDLDDINVKNEIIDNNTIYQK